MAVDSDLEKYLACHGDLSPDFYFGSPSPPHGLLISFGRETCLFFRIDNDRHLGDLLNDPADGGHLDLCTYPSVGDTGQ